MSEATKADLERALTAHIADVTDGDIITDCTSMDEIGTGTTRYWCEGNNAQPVHVTIGLLQYARETTTWSDDDDD